MDIIVDINFVKLLFTFLTISIAITSFLIHCNERVLPLLLTRSFRYGKYAEKADHSIVKRFELPKRYFKHFYLFSTPLSTAVLLLIAYRYFFGGEIFGIIYNLLDLQLGTSRLALVPLEATTIASILITIQCWKRLYETHCISIYSNAKMNLSHYIAGFLHYIGVSTCIIGESYGFVQGSDNTFKWYKVNIFHLLCAIIFLLAAYEQLHTNCILANLRKNKEGKIVTTKYQLPTGRLFEYVSSPLQLTEVVMYLMLTLILWRSSSFHYITMWVVINQMAAALLNDQWYRKTFKNYPHHRRMLIPFLI